jgi:PP-loop superfamily ATP-utilizing enzyme
MDIKIRNDGRRKKRESEKVTQLYNSLTPPKYTCKQSVYNTVAKWEKKYGYNYDCREDELNPYLR